MNPWPDMKWWDSGERQAAEEKLDDLKRAGVICNPKLQRLYDSLRATPEREVRVAIIGQDPYPSYEMATGVAFSVPRVLLPADWPHTLKIILGEYSTDLGFSLPSHGDLSGWTSRGVLLWNAIPACQSGHSLSCDWDEWSFLTGEIVDRLSRKGIVFVFLGQVASRFADRVDLSRNRVIRTSHPSPRGIRSSKTPFTGSRLFSTANARLVELHQEPVDWELKDESPRKGDVPTPELGRGTLLQNITGANLGGLKKQGTSPNIYTSLMF